MHENDAYVDRLLDKVRRLESMLRQQNIEMRTACTDKLLAGQNEVLSKLYYYIDERMMTLTQDNIDLEFELSNLQTRKLRLKSKNSEIDRTKAQLLTEKMAELDASLPQLESQGEILRNLRRFLDRAFPQTQVTAIDTMRTDIFTTSAKVDHNLREMLRRQLEKNELREAQFEECSDDYSSVESSPRSEELPVDPKKAMANLGYVYSLTLSPDPEESSGTVRPLQYGGNLLHVVDKHTKAFDMYQIAKKRTF